MGKNQTISYRELFVIFLKGGFAFGGGLGILATLEREFVEKRKIMTRQEFLTMYGIGRIVPSGTLTALAVGYGYKYKKLPGSIVALTALILPGFSLTILLATMYTTVKDTVIFDYMNVSILPAAVGLIVIAALNLSKEIYSSPILILFAFAAFIATFVLNINPSVVLIVGGLLSIFLLRKVEGSDNVSS